MDPEAIPLILSLLVASITSLILAAYAWRRRSVPGGFSFTLLSLGAAEWSLAYLMETTHASLAMKWLFFQVKYVGVGTLTLFLFAFVMQYTGRGARLNPRIKLLLWLALLIKPVGILILLWVPQLSHLFVSGQHVLIESPFPVLTYTREIGYNFSGFYDLFMSLVSAGLLVLQMQTASAIHRRQLSWLFAAIALPWAGGLLSYLSMPFLANIDTGPILFSVSLPLVALGTFRYRLFDLVPVAREVVLASMDDGILVLDPNGRVLDINPAAQAIFGPEKVHIGQLVQPVVEPCPALRDALLDSSVHEARVALGENGAQRFYEVRKSSLQAQSEQAGSLVILRDISERSRLEDALSSSELKYRSVVERGNDGIAILQDAMIVYCNPQLASMVGRSAEEITGLPVVNILFPDVREDMLKRFWRRVDGFEEPERYETYLRHQDGDRVEVEVTAGMIEYEGQPAVLIFAHDIAQRKRNLQIVHESEERYRRISEMISDFAYACRIEPDGRIISVWATGGAFTRITGVAVSEMDPYSALISRITLEDAYIALHHTDRLFEGKPDVAEFRITGKDGELHWIRNYVRPVWDDQEGRVTSFYGASQDVTERKRMEENLREAKEAAEAATRAKSQFLANMSHEIRTPLNAIIGMTSLLLNTRLEGEQRDFTETIRTSGEALLTVINDILDFSKIEAGKLELEKQPFNLRLCVEEALDIIAPHAAGKSLDLVYEIQDETPQAIIGDVARLRQVLVNLVGNAVKFTEKGEVAIAISGDGMLIKTGEPCEIHFAIRDTGIGIPRDRLDRLFQSFSQVDSSTTRKYGGTGLGLAITSRLVDLMGGRIWVESEEGRGSIFHVHVPFEAAEPLPVVRVRPEPGQLIGKHALVVDDNDTNRLILARQMQAWGMEVSLACSGVEALKQFADHSAFDLVVLDMQMPGMDGLSLAREIRNQQDHWVPLIMLTSIGQSMDREELRHLSACLTKPVKPSQLYDLLNDLFVQEDEGEAQPVSSSADLATPDFAARNPLRILLAEDNAVNQKVALRMLERLGYRADVAGNGLEVLAALERQPYDLILMDIQMPELDGLEATAHINRRWGADRPFRILAMTAYAFQADLERCMAAGMNGYVTKPIRMEALMDALEHITANAKVAKPAYESAEGAQESQLIDLARMQDLIDSLADGVADVVESYLEDTPLLIDEMRTALANGDQDDLQRIAHSLKSSSGIFGAQQMVELSRSIEMSARAGRLSSPEPLDELVAIFEKVRGELLVYLNR